MSEAQVEKFEGGAGLAVIEPTPELVEQVRAAILDGELPPEIGDPQLTARAIKERILAGSLAESMEPAQALPAWRDYMDEDVAVQGFHLNPSNIANDDGEKGVYAVVQIMLVESGEIVTVHCGGGNVLAQLVNAWENGAFPFRGKLVERTAGSGRGVLWIEKV